MNLFFSVIIPLYNKERYIEATLKSVLDQTYTDFEIIIVDDGSTDKSFEVISQIIDSRVTFIKQENQGASQARNLGIEKATGKYIALLDADDYWHNNHLLELKKLIESFPNAGLFCNNYEINYNTKFIKPAHFNFKFNTACIIVKDYFKSSTINSVAWTSSVAFLKSDFDKIGRFNKSLRTGQDIDLWIRFALKYDIAFNPNITMRYHNFDATSLSKSTHNQDRYNLIKGFSKEEKQNSSLKTYLDINRYALSIRCKINDEFDLYKKVKKEIDQKNLNTKQKLLLKTPRSLLVLMRNIQRYSIDKGMYLTSYS